MKKFFLSFLVFLALGAIVTEVFHYTRHEARKNRHFTVSTSQQWKELVPTVQKQEIPEEIKRILHQPFFFLGHGRQTIAFGSADGSSVLKLFKNVRKKKKQRRVRESLLGALLAHTKLSQETGILFCSVIGFDGDLPPVTLLMKKGAVEEIDLSSTPFVLQKRAFPLKEELLRMRCAGKIDQAQECIKSVFELLASCREKQVVDRDGSLIRNGNIGLLGTKAMLLDTGKLCTLTDRTKHTLHDLNRLKPLTSWCRKAFPELLPTLKQCRDSYESEHPVQ